MTEIKLVDSTCRGCKYLMPMPGADNGRACDYIGHTGTRRPCPAGKGCTVRVTGKRKPVSVPRAR